MNRGVDRQRIFFADADRIEFGHRLAAINERFGVEVQAYCLLSNHFHLLVRCPDGELSAAMQHLLGLYTRHTNDRVGRDGPLFRGRFRSIHVDNDAYLLTAIRYIHRNALDVAGVRDVDDYRWSSHRAYLGMRRRPGFLDTSPLDVHFAGDTGRFHRFVSQDWNPAAVPPTSAELRCLVDLVVAEHETDEECESGRGVRPRAVLLALLPQLHGQVHADLRALLDDPSVSAVGRARRRLTTDARLRSMVGSVLETCGVQRLAA